MEDADLNASLGQADLFGEPLAGEDVRIVGALEFLLQTLDLLVGERGAVALQFALQPQPHLWILVARRVVAVRASVRHVAVVAVCSFKNSFEKSDTPFTLR